MTLPDLTLSLYSSETVVLSFALSRAVMASSLVLPTMSGMVTGMSPLDSTTVISALWSRVEPGVSEMLCRAPSGSVIEYSAEESSRLMLVNPAFSSALIGSLPSADVGSAMSLGMVACLTPSDTVTVMRPLWRLLIWVPTFCGSAEMMFPLATVSLYASEEVNGMFATFSVLW